jgi:hypothetical protein
MWTDIPGPFLGNCSVNTFPLLGSRFLTMQQLGYNAIAVFSLLSVLRSYKREDPCGGGVEYLDRDPASRRRRRKWKSQICFIKILPTCPMFKVLSNSKRAFTSIQYKRQTCPLVRKGAPEKQDRNCQKVVNIWSWAPNGARPQDLLIYWQSVAMWLWLWLWLDSLVNW